MKKNTERLLLLAIVLIAMFFRFYQITRMPGGLFPDEAANGLDINLMQQGHLQPFYERGNGREALFFYMLWGSVEVFGKGPWQHHIVSAAVGVLAVLLCYAAARELFLLNRVRSPENESRAAKIALLSAFFMAVSSWHVVLSRTAFRANLIPLFSALSFWLLLKTFSSISPKKKIWYAFGFGAAFALGFYTYIAYRIMIPIVGVLFVWAFFSLSGNGRIKETVLRYLKPSVAAVLAFLIFIFPLARYFYQHINAFVGRSGQVSVFNPELYTVDGMQYHGRPPLGVVIQAATKVLEVSMSAYFTQGDLNWRHNISGWPFLSPLVSPFFALGLLGATIMGIYFFLRPARKRMWMQYGFLALWFWGMMLPVVTTAEGIPHGLRAIGTIPPVFILAGLAFEYVLGVATRLHEFLHEKRYASFGHHWKHNLEGWGAPLVRLGFKVALVIFFVGLGIQTYAGYFVYAASSPENFYYFRSDLTPVSEYLVKRCQKDSTYLVLDKFSVQTTDYFTSDPHGNFSSPCSVPYHQVDPENSWQLSGLKIGDQIVFTQSSIFDIKKFKTYHPTAALVHELRNQFGQAVLAVYEVKK